MKKILNILLLLSLLVTLNVKADAGPPMFPTIDVEISNKDGAKCYDHDNQLKKTLPYGEKYSASQDIQDENKYFINTEEDYEYCYVSAKDVVVKTKDFKVEEGDKNEIKGKALFLDNVTIYSGPATLFDKVGTIPKGTTLNPEYEYNYYWLYVSYNGMKGFVSRHKGRIVLEALPSEDEDITIVTFAKTPIYSFENWNLEKRKEIGSIPANTEIKNYWTSTDNGGEVYTYYYLTYNGVSGFVPIGNKFDSFAAKCDGYKIQAKKSVDVYKTVEFDDSDISAESIGKIEANKEYDVKYCGMIPEYIYYIPSLKGWVIERDTDPYIIETNKDGEVYDHTVSDEDDDPNPENPISDPDPIEPEKPEPEKPVKETKKLSYDELIMICVGAGILIAVTILVTIKLVNKRKEETNMSE